MRAGSAMASSARHVVGVGLQALLVAAIIAAIAFAGSTIVGSAPGGAQSVLAAKGGNGGGNGGNGGGNGAGSTATDASIVLDQLGQPLALGTNVTFTSNVVGLTGNEYALVYLRCVESGTVVYGQLDLPGTVFVLGGGSSPWWQVGGQADCTAYLYAYGSHAGGDTARVLAETPSFVAN